MKRIPPLPRRLAALAGIFALLLQLLLPVHGIAAPAGDRVPVCTAVGIVWQTMDGAPSAPGADRIAASCPFCLIHGAAMVPPLRVAVPLPVVHPVTPQRAVAEIAAVRAPFRVPPSRGPPPAA
jgi:hypothetical protein